MPALKTAVMLSKGQVQALIAASTVILKDISALKDGSEEGKHLLEGMIALSCAFHDDKRWETKS
jgi:hypothetical protein